MNSFVFFFNSLISNINSYILSIQGEDNLVVPIHAFPVMDTSKFPPKLVFSDKGIVLGQNYTQVLPLFSYCPVEFEFEINILQSHPSFKVYPQSGRSVISICIHCFIP